MDEITMRPTAGEFLLNGVRVGAWHETAKGVVHAQAITGKNGQYPTYEAAAEAITGAVTEWLSAIAGRSALSSKGGADEQ